MREVRANGTSTDSHLCSTAGMLTLRDLTGLQKLGEVFTNPHRCKISEEEQHAQHYNRQSAVPTGGIHSIGKKEKVASSKEASLPDGEKPSFTLEQG